MNLALFIRNRNVVVDYEASATIRGSCAPLSSSPLTIGAMMPEDARQMFLCSDTENVKLSMSSMRMIWNSVIL